MTIFVLCVGFGLGWCAKAAWARGNKQFEERVSEDLAVARLRRGAAVAADPRGDVDGGRW